MADFPALPLWTDALIGDTTHLTTEEFGAYVKLLICAWRRPHCDLPDDDTLLARFSGLTLKKWRSMSAIIRAFFTRRYRFGEWVVHQKRLRKERAFVIRRSRKQSRNRRGKGNLSSSRGNNNLSVSKAPNDLKNNKTNLTMVQPWSNHPTPTPTLKEKRTSNDVPKKKGSRLPADWQPSEVNLAYAKARGWGGQPLSDMVENFRDYWKAKAGANAVKRDWDSTWKTWVRRSGKAPASCVQNADSGYASILY